MKHQSLSRNSSTFEAIKRVSDGGDDSWSARELARVLDYSEFRHFLAPLEKAKEACTKSGHKVEDHFEQILDMVGIGSGARFSYQDHIVEITDMVGNEPENRGRSGNSTNGTNGIGDRTHHRKSRIRGGSEYSATGIRERSGTRASGWAFHSRIMVPPYSPQPTKAPVTMPPQPFAKLLAPVGGDMRPNESGNSSEELGPGGWIEYFWPMERESGPCPGAQTSLDAIRAIPAPNGGQDHSPGMSGAIPRDFAIPGIMHPNGVRERVVCEKEVGL